MGSASKPQPNSTLPVGPDSLDKLKSSDGVSHSHEETSFSQRHREECSSYAVGRIAHMTDSGLGEEIHFIAQGLKKAFLERTCLKAQLTACLAVVAKVS